LDATPANFKVFYVLASANFRTVVAPDTLNFESHAHLIAAIFATVTAYAAALFLSQLNADTSTVTQKAVRQFNGLAYQFVKRYVSGQMR